MKTFKLVLSTALLGAMAAQPAFSQEGRPGRPDRPSRPDGDRPSRPDRPNPPDRPNRPDRPSRPDRPVRPGKPHRPDVIVVPGRDRHHHHHYRNGYNYGYNYGYSDGYYTEASCSPEVKQKNVVAVENELTRVMNSPKFRDATVLRSTVNEIKSSRGVDNKINAYLDLVGVDSKKPRDVAEFVGSRGNDRERFIQRAQTRLKLSGEQADILVDRVSQTLLNGINR
jgi:hypothetical protein